jgi:hypothetical protein
MEQHELTLFSARHKERIEQPLKSFKALCDDLAAAVGSSSADLSVPKSINDCVTHVRKVCACRRCVCFCGIFRVRGLCGGATRGRRCSLNRPSRSSSFCAGGTYVCACT